MIKFEFRCINEATGDTVVSDWVEFDPARIDQFGGCEIPEIAVASALRAVRRDLLAGKLDSEDDKADNSQFGVGT